jgi:cytochrome c
MTLHPTLIRNSVLALPVVVGAALFASAPQAQVANGELLYRQRCGACHVVTPGGTSGPIAPNLRGVTGRKAATTAYKGYTPALKAANLTWTRANLDTFVAAPTRMVPGTRMTIAVANPQQRAAILDYLATQR